MRLGNHYRLYIGKFDMNTNQLFDHIFQQQESNPSLNFYLLLDTAKNHIYIRRWLKTLPEKQFNQIGNLFHGTIDETSPLEVSPLLLHINQENNEVLQRTLLVSENIGMFSLIETSLSKQSLIKHLQPFLQAEMPNGELALFRFYDPSITKILDKMLDKQEYQKLFKPLNNWWVQQANDTFNNLVSD